jgi:uncharacterized membrane protein YkgB
MKISSALSLFALLLFFTSLVVPVSAGPIDTSIEVVSRGIEQFFVSKAEQNLQENYGVTFGNASEAESITPAQRIVYMIAVANQNPYEVKSVCDQLASDLVWFSIATVFMSGFFFGSSMLHKYMPETIEKINKKLTGHNDIDDYSVWLGSLLKMVGLAILMMPIIAAILEFETILSSGLTLNAFEFLQTTPASPSIFYWESQAYGFCSTFFLFRIEYINFFAAHAFKIILMFCAAIFYSDYIAKILAAWFLSSVFMRPLVLWYSNIAIKNIAEAYPQTNSTFGNFVATYDMGSIVAMNMKMVTFASALTVIIALLWPVIMAVIEIVFGCLLGVLLKFAKIFRYMKGF